MAEDSGISWTDNTFNPWIGCTKVSPACDNCYAEAFDNRFGGHRWGPHADRTRTSVQNWNKVKRWQRKARENGVRQIVFCASLADVFDNHRSIQQEWRDDLWQLVRETPDLIWMLLTKRPQNIERYLPDDWGNGYPNVTIGCSVENQTEHDRRLPHMRRLRAVAKFFSMEPLLGSVELPGDIADHIDYIIVGGESGPGARPMNPEWAKELRDRCLEDGVPFHFKQWGEFGEDGRRSGVKNTGHMIGGAEYKARIDEVLNEQ